MAYENEDPWYKEILRRLQPSAEASEMPAKAIYANTPTSTPTPKMPGGYPKTLETTPPIETLLYKENPGEVRAKARKYLPPDIANDYLQKYDAWYRNSQIGVMTQRPPEPPELWQNMEREDIREATKRGPNIQPAGETPLNKAVGKLKASKKQAKPGAMKYDENGLPPTPPMAEDTYKPWTSSVEDTPLPGMPKPLAPSTESPTQSQTTAQPSAALTGSVGKVTQAQPFTPPARPDVSVPHAKLFPKEGIKGKLVPGETSSSSSSISYKDPTAALQTSGALAEAQKGLLKARLEPQEQYIKDVEQQTKQKYGNLARLYNTYHGSLDKSTRGQFWQDMVHALGQVAAGAAGYATGKQVVDYYKPTKIFDKKTVDADARARMELQSDLANKRFNDIIETLKSRKDLTADQKSVEFAAAVEQLKRDYDVRKDSMSTTTMQDSTKSDIFNIPQDPRPPADKYKTPTFTEQKEPTYPQEAAKQNIPLKQAIARFQNNPVSGNTVEEQANNFAATRSAGSEIPAGSLANLYKYAAQRANSTDPQVITKKAHEILARQLSQQPDAHTKEAWIVYMERKALANAGVEIFWTVPSVKMRTKDGLEYESQNPDDVRNPNSFRNTPEFKAEQEKILGNKK